MIRIKLMDGGTLEIPREEAIELLPYRGVFSSALLKSPLEGVLPYRGKLLPVLGPLPPSETPNLPLEERPWLLLLRGCAQVVRGLPEFDDTIAGSAATAPADADQERLLADIDELLKAA
jgi:hypothetical protein